MAAVATPRWWLFIHQIPPKPDYLRVKVGRRLQRIGAVALKNTVYALPRAEACHEDLQWVFREIRDGGGEAMLFAADVVDGLTNAEVEQLFCAARDADYMAVATEARQMLQLLDAGAAELPDLTQVARLQRKLDEIGGIDFFGASGREVASGLLTGLRVRLEPPPDAQAATPVQQWQGRTWVTRTGIQVDRIACAWLIRRYVDPHAVFKFVPPTGYQPLPDELRFDMYTAEFTHECDKCSFEVLVERMGLTATPGLQALAEIIHDIDVKDGKFARPEAPGVAAFLRGMTQKTPDDDERLRLGCAYFDTLLAAF